MTASRLADCCPFCWPGDHPALLPLTVASDEHDSLRAHYRHDACGREWNTWWNREAAGWPALDREPVDAAAAVEEFLADLRNRRTA